jgi:hypothetical protein
MSIPDYSPAMLASFLRIRVAYANLTAFKPGHDTIKAERAMLAHAAGVTPGDFWVAWQGNALGAGLRARLWAALGVYPADFGVVLDDAGGQTPDNPKVTGERP